MTRASLIKIAGTVASGVASCGALFVPEPWRDVVLALALATLTALHIPRPGDVKA